MSRGGAASPGAHRLGLRAPEPARRPAHGRHRRRQRRRAADGASARATTARIRAGGARLARPGRDRRRSHRRSARRPSPAACSSGCRSPATWSRGRGWSSWTSRPAASTSRCRRGCSICCAAWWPSSASPPIVVTHDLAVARLLAHRLLVMRRGAGGRDRAHRPGARRSAASLHAAAGLLGAAAVTRRRRSATSRVCARPSRCTCRAASSCRCCAASSLSVRAGRVRRAGRSLGRGQEHAAALRLRQLPAAGRAASSCSTAAMPSTSSSAEPRRVLAVRRRDARLCEPVPARHPARARARRRGRAAAARGRGRDEARRARARRCWRGCAIPERLWRLLAGHLLRRRAAAGQHRPRASRPTIRSCCSTSRPPRSTPRTGRVVVDLIAEAQARGRGDRRHLPRRRGARGRSAPRVDARRTRQRHETSLVLANALVVTRDGGVAMAAVRVARAASPRSSAGGGARPGALDSTATG